MHHITILQIRRLGHERRLVEIGIEFLRLAILRLLAGVEALQTVLREGAHEDVLGHLEAGHEIQQVLVGLGLGGVELVGGNGEQGAVEVVDALQEVDGEALDGEVAGAIHVALRALLEVAEVGDRAEVFVLVAALEQLDL